MDKAEWFRAHAEYLDSRAWKRRRSLVLARDQHRCMAVLPGCEVLATQVHHLTYRHWRNEPLFDLVAVCPPCHIAITAMDRGEVADVQAQAESPGIRLEDMLIMSLTGGPKAIHELVSALDAQPDTIRKCLTRCSRFVRLTEGGGRGNVTVWGLANHPSVAS
jgi:hypothetical protein